MEILWWLAPPTAVTLLAMLWVAWLGRESDREVDRDQAVARIGAALAKDHRGQRRPVPERTREKSTGVAIRRTS